MGPEEWVGCIDEGNGRKVEVRRSEGLITLVPVSHTEAFHFTLIKMWNNGRGLAHSLVVQRGPVCVLCCGERLRKATPGETARVVQ